MTTEKVIIIVVSFYAVIALIKLGLRLYSEKLDRGIKRMWKELNTVKDDKEKLNEKENQK